MFENILYKIDNENKRLTDNIYVDFQNNGDGTVWFNSSQIDTLKLSVGDIVHFSAGDCTSNTNYRVTQIYLNAILCEKS
ncbi:MAG: hypothetical protein IJT84_06405 [Clostridia bacterium]|nr:hypothetical protein [Clostridia bacterium]